jgi:hypothetical protein
VKGERMARERRPDRHQRLAPSADPAKNLAAAWFFYGHLTEEQTRGFNAQEEPQRFYMGACINFACGAVEALSARLGVKDAGLDEGWRKQQSAADLALFDRLWQVRIEDFHYGVLDAKPGHAWVNAAAGIQGVKFIEPPGTPLLEETNPDGEVVRGGVLVSIKRLYIDHENKQLAAMEACRRFVVLVESLICSTSLPPRAKTP